MNSCFRTDVILNQINPFLYDFESFWAFAQQKVSRSPGEIMCLCNPDFVCDIAVNQLG